MGLMATPQSTAITSFFTVTCPVSISTSTSANCPAKGGGESVATKEAVAMICRC
jgi:hypothetical protein